MENPIPINDEPFSARILVLDDDPSVQRISRRLLEHLGHAVELAGTGAEAVELYTRAMQEGRPFALVLVDLTLSGGEDGLSVFIALKRLDSGVRAVVSSGNPYDAVMLHFQEHGFAGRLRKPYTLHELRDLLASSLKIRPSD